MARPKTGGMVFATFARLQASWNKRNIMNLLDSLDQEVLLDALADCCEKCRFIADKNCNQKSYNLFKESLISYPG